MPHVIQRFSSFSDGVLGGNPAGVCIGTAFPSPQEMQNIAADIGFSETVFAMPIDGKWRVRYFSPEHEVPFCGHATIALGAALAEKYGDGDFQLKLNTADISVSGKNMGDLTSATLQSPPTYSRAADPKIIAEIFELFGYSVDDLDSAIPCGFAQAGATHIVIALNSQETLARMSYDLDLGRTLMNKYGLTTIAFVVAETPQRFHVRNAFASGGVIEDPATGAAAAAMAGYLRDIDWPHKGQIKIIQGENMGLRSIINMEIPSDAGGSIKVSGTVRHLI